MTKEQITYIVTELLHDNMDTLTTLRNNANMLVCKTIRCYTDINKYRYYFDTTLEVLKVYHVRKFSNDINKLPKHGNYSIINMNDENIVFEIISDKDGKAVYDCYSFDSIKIFNIAKNNQNDFIKII